MPMDQCVEYEHAVRRLHVGGARPREIAEALVISHQVRICGECLALCEEIVAGEGTR